jgi:hypothetical protein
MIKYGFATRQEVEGFVKSQIMRDADGTFMILTGGTVKPGEGFSPAQMTAFETIGAVHTVRRDDVHDEAAVKVVVTSAMAEVPVGHDRAAAFLLKALPPGEGGASPLLEVMAEQKVKVGGKTLKMSAKNVKWWGDILKGIGQGKL